MLELLSKLAVLLLLPPDSVLRTKLFWKRFATATVTILAGIVLFANCGQPFVPEQEAGCTDSSCPMVVEVPPAPSETVVTGDNWEFVLPGDGWAKMTLPVDGTSIQDVYVKGNKEAIVLLTKVELDGGNLSQLVVATVKEMIMGEAHLDVLEQMTINHVKFIKVTGHLRNGTDNVTIFSWVGVKDKFGYVVHCAGRDLSDAGSELIINLCESVGNTIQLN